MLILCKAWMCVWVYMYLLCPPVWFCSPIHKDNHCISTITMHSIQSCTFRQQLHLCICQWHVINSTYKAYININTGELIILILLNKLMYICKTNTQVSYGYDCMGSHSNSHTYLNLAYFLCLGNKPWSDHLTVHSQNQGLCEQLIIKWC